MSHYVGREIIEGTVGRVEYEVRKVIGGDGGNQDEEGPRLNRQRERRRCSKGCFWMSLRCNGFDPERGHYQAIIEMIEMSQLAYQWVSRSLALEQRPFSHIVP